ncbi:F-box protein At3g07870-like isoform X2 [Macadamia integrifolia]|uniref:F-box protein At3g07870-like isoform X2 n=1 Tax=Macadamia integrifolia TaxID=60698 RepID=UPI001C4E9A44|nr:F-box protein At3g07870-like isoform X2 [Macadamia integrifolia]
MGGRRRKNLSKIGETANKGKEKAKEDQSHIVSSNVAEVKLKNKEVADATHVNIASHPQFFGYEDFDSDHGYGFDYDYDGMGFDDIDLSDPFSYDDYTDPLRYDEDGNYRGDYSHWGGDQRHWAEFFGYPIPGYQDEEDEEEEEEEVDDDYTYEMAILQKEEDEQMEKPMNIGVMSKLPSEVVFDILSRLPIKTLARCRCVSKDMRRITHIRRFIQMHHNRAIQGDIPPSLLVHARYCIDELPNDIYLLQHDTCDDTLDGRAVVAHPQFSTRKKFEVVGSCNGLLCLSEPRHYGPRFVCNPVTGEYISLPKPDKHTDFDIVSGFGYDEMANEYKVVRMLFRSVDLECGSGTSTFKLEGEVYSLSLGNWRHIGDAPYALRGKASSAFVNGALHWMTDELRELIVSFDLGREEFRVVPPPPGFVPGCRSHSLNLGVLGEHLCLFDYSINGQLEIWVMKEYGMKWSWTKEYVISRKILGLDSGHFIPLRLMKNGELLIWYEDEGLGFYNPVKKEFRDFQIRGLPPCFEAITHAGSLLPLRNAVGLAKSDGCNFSFGKWCPTLFPIPAHESIKYGDKQPTEHGLNPDGENEEDVQFSERPEGQDGLQGEEGQVNVYGGGLKTFLRMDEYPVCSFGVMWGSM